MHCQTFPQLLVATPICNMAMKAHGGSHPVVQQQQHQRMVLMRTISSACAWGRQRYCSSGAAAHYRPSIAGAAAAVNGMGRRFTEQEYLLQKQSQERAEWAASVRKATGSRRHQFWEPQLDPPPLLDGVTVVLVSPRRPVSMGTVARAASCFEVSSLRVVQPREEYVTRHSKSASKGAQYLLFKAQSYASVAEATADCDLSVAFTRWVAGRSNAFYDLSALVAHPTMQALIREPVPVSSCSDDQSYAGQTGGAARSADVGQQGHISHDTTQSGEHLADADNAVVAAQQLGSLGNGTRSSSSAAAAAVQAADSSTRQATEGGGGAPASQHNTQRTRVALVFGREELGLADDEVDACDAVCSIPIGRLQESLSLSHAVSIALSGIYAQRLAYVVGEGAAGGVVGGGAAQPGSGADRYVVRSVQGLAAGYDSTEGGTEQ